MTPRGRWKPPPAPPFRELDPVGLTFCHRCGCTYANGCPEHVTSVVTLGPGRDGFRIEE